MKKIKLLVLAACLGLPMHAFAGIAIIGNADVNVDSLTQGDAKNIFLCKKKYLADGKKVVFSYLEEGNDTRKEFNATILNKKSKSLKRHWSKIKFTGECDQPVVLEDDNAVRNWVKSTPGAIGYINASSVADGDKVLYKK